MRFSTIIASVIGLACSPRPSAPSMPPPTDPSTAVNAGRCSGDGVLDGFEDGDAQVADYGGRVGYWYTYADEVGSTVDPRGRALAPVAGGANGTARALRFAGKIAPQGIVFAGAGVGFVEPKRAYDASCCRGIQFWAKATGCRGLVRLLVADVNTTPDGGRCQRCYDDFGKTYALTPEWTRYELAFADMTQEGWGEQQPALDASRLFQVQWGLKDFDCEYEVFLDEIAFYGCSP